MMTMMMIENRHIFSITDWYVNRWRELTNIEQWCWIARSYTMPTHTDWLIIKKIDQLTRIDGPIDVYFVECETQMVIVVWTIYIYRYIWIRFALFHFYIIFCSSRPIFFSQIMECLHSWRRRDCLCNISIYIDIYKYILPVVWVINISPI